MPSARWQSADLRPSGRKQGLRPFIQSHLNLAGQNWFSSFPLCLASLAVVFALLNNNLIPSAYHTPHAMTDGLSQTQFSQEDVKALSEIVQQYVDGKSTRNTATAALSSVIATACLAHGIKPDADHILPYLEQLDEHDQIQDQRGAGAVVPGGSDGDNGDNGEGDGDPGDDEGEVSPSGDRTLSLKDRLSEPDDDGEYSRAKRLRVDPSNFAWRSRAQDFLDSLGLTPEHQHVQQQVEIYSRDVKAAVCDLLNSFRVPALPELQWKNVLLDRFVDFDSILTSSFAIDAEESQRLVLGDSHVEIKKPRVVSKVSTHGQWINARWRHRRRLELFLWWTDH